MAQDKSPDSTGAGRGIDGDDAPLPPAVVALKTAVYLMGMVLVAGFAFLVYTLVSRAYLQPAAELDAKAAAQQVSLAPGETIQSISLDRNLLALQIRRADGGTYIVVHDINLGETVRRIEVTAE
jgi:hypothetical protein